MRILAIRGKNLASLADEFEILLNEGALQNAGLFAITGQTGAGKSTILDALCLALYDKIPRLPDGAGFAVGHKDEDENQRVKHNDVRSILRRGASHAYAEVDFIGKDKQPYRARWQVSKARGKAGGRLQAQEMLLSHIKTGQRLGQTKTSTLEAISDLVDLSFEQFRRSVLLAQGDFAAFLKAKKDERSSLLERITGTELYSEISIAAFNRAKEEKTELDRITALMQNQIPLETVARLELEQQRDLCVVQLQGLEQQISDNQKIIDWYLELKKRLDAEQLASLALEQSLQTWQDAEPLRLRIKQVQDVQPLRPLLNQYQQNEMDCFDAEQQLKNALALQANAEIKLQNATQHLKTQTEILIAAETKQQQAQPVLKNIRALDTRLEILQTTLNGLNDEEKQLQTALKTAQAEHNALLKQQTDTESAARTLTDWLAEQQGLASLAADWTHWESELNRYAQLIKQRTAQLTTAEQHKQIVDKNQQRLSALQADMDAKKQLLQNQQGSLDELKKQVDSEALSQLHTTRETLEIQAEQINRARTLATQALECQQLITQDAQRLIDTQQIITDTNQQLTQRYEQQNLNNNSLSEAKKALALIEASSHKDAVQLRALLIEQQPCPVCGALEHPWQHQAVLFNNELTQAQQNRVDELEQEKALLIKAISNACQLIDQEKTNVIELNNKLKLAQQKIQTLNSDWNALIEQCKPRFVLQYSLNDEQLLALLTQYHESVSNELNQIKQQEKAALDLQKQLKTIQDLFDSTKQSYDSLSNDYAALDKQHAQHKAELRATIANIESLESQLNSIVEALSVPCELLADWKTYLASPSSLSKKIQHYQQTQQELATHTKNLATIQQQIQLVAQNDQHKQQQLTIKQAAIQREVEQQKSLLIERAEWLKTIAENHNTADGIEQSLNQQLNTAKTAQQQVSNAVNTATTELATQKNQHQHWQQENTHRAERLQTALNSLTQALEKLGINHSQLSELLQQDESWLNAQKANIAELEKNLQAATTLLNVKTEDRKHHEKLTVAISEDTAKQTAAQLQQQKQLLSEQKQEHELQLREDDKKLTSSSHLKTELDKQRQRWEQWQSLNELIGSSNGSKFRTFAQSLTLEALLAHSNKHLADFAKRYVLQRVPSSDLELQIIDKDMADDVRSVHSLSGGESFLVSLALALGLASLSSNKTQVESLFIDEGFGSLDPETLDIAIASLDTLQALGRKVGVISHVPILVERIGVKVLVEKCGGGRSTVTIVDGY